MPDIVSLFYAVLRLFVREIRFSYELVMRELRSIFSCSVPMRIFEFRYVNDGAAACE